MFGLNAIRTLLPTRCVLCGGPGQKTLPLCAGCQTDLPWLNFCCQRCAIPLPPQIILPDSGECGECLYRPPLWRCCVAAFEYRPPIDLLINSYKQRSNLTNGRILAELLAGCVLEWCGGQRENVSDQESPDNANLYSHALPDLLIPVPLHWRRQCVRGFNQSYDLARLLSQQLGIPCSHKHCRKRHATTAQHDLPRKARTRNLRNVFEIRGAVDGLNIALIDDVVTTGSTANALTAKLLKAGAKTVDVWCVARTPLK